MDELFDTIAKFGASSQELKNRTEQWVEKYLDSYADLLQARFNDFTNKILEDDKFHPYNILCMLSVFFGKKSSPKRLELANLLGSLVYPLIKGAFQHYCRSSRRNLKYFEALKKLIINKFDVLKPFSSDIESILETIESYCEVTEFSPENKDTMFSCCSIINILVTYLIPPNDIVITSYEIIHIIIPRMVVNGQSDIVSVSIAAIFLSMKLWWDTYGYRHISIKLLMKCYWKTIHAIEKFSLPELKSENEESIKKFQKTIQSYEFKILNVLGFDLSLISSSILSSKNDSVITSLFKIKRLFLINDIDFNKMNEILTSPIYGFALVSFQQDYKVIIAAIYFIISNCDNSIKSEWITRLKLEDINFDPIVEDLKQTQERWKAEVQPYISLVNKWKAESLNAHTLEISKPKENFPQSGSSKSLSLDKSSSIYGGSNTNMSFGDHGNETNVTLCKLVTSSENKILSTDSEGIGLVSDSLSKFGKISSQEENDWVQFSSKHYERDKISKGYYNSPYDMEDRSYLQPQSRHRSFSDIKKDNSYVDERVNRIYISNLDINVQKIELYEFFDNFVGEQVIQKLFVSSPVGSSKTRYAIADLNSYRNAEKAIVELNGRILFGKTISVDWNSNKIEHYDPGHASSKESLSLNKKYQGYDHDKLTPKDYKLQNYDYDEGHKVSINNYTKRPELDVVNVPYEVEIYIGGLPRDIDAGQVYDLFDEKIGKGSLRAFKINRGFDYGFGFVKSLEVKEQCDKLLHNTLFHGQKILIRLSNRSKDQLSNDSYQTTGHRSESNKLYPDYGLIYDPIDIPPDHTSFTKSYLPHEYHPMPYIDPTKTTRYSSERDEKNSHGRYFEHCRIHQDAPYGNKLAFERYRDSSSIGNHRRSSRSPTRDRVIDSIDHFNDDRYQYQQKGYSDLQDTKYIHPDFEINSSRLFVGCRTNDIRILEDCVRSHLKSFNVKEFNFKQKVDDKIFKFGFVEFCNPDDAITAMNILMKVYLDTYVLQVSFAKQREAIPSKHKYEVPNYSNMSKPLHTNTKVVSEFEINNYTNKRKASHDSSNSDFKRNGSKNVYDRKQYGMMMYNNSMDLEDGEMK